ncbi:FCSD flavin-binding domain-containing protein [Halomonas sp. E19]|uniref:FCSD flavin-binding domain-containing protein n=1 Tax=Halomonas sp. E19 TaxID=3397247 RepID=UPI0040346990
MDQHLLQPGGPGLRHLGGRCLPRAGGRHRRGGGAGGVSPADAPSATRALEAEYAVGWYNAICQDTWGTQL